MTEPDHIQSVADVVINGDTIKITAEPSVNITAAVNSKIFDDWCRSIDPRFQIRAIHIQSVDMRDENVRFIKLKADVIDRTDDAYLPGSVFLRGHSVAILVVLECNGLEYAVLAVQPRVAIGDFELQEVLAGMLDESNDFAGVAAKELREEGGDTFALTASDLIDLTDAVGCMRPIYLSPGGSDEAMRFFLHRRQVTFDELNALRGKATGVLEDGEHIKLKVVPLEDLDVIDDGKTIIAAALYRRYKRLQELARAR